VKQQKMGGMFVNYRSARRFATEERKNIELFANQAAVAIRNAQLYIQVLRRFHSLR
jgi:GAF domain-containing protein